MINYQYAIELGGATTKIYSREGGLVLCEPTLVAAQPIIDGFKVLGLGDEARKLQGKTYDEVEIFSPISDGVVKNFEYCLELLQYFFKKVCAPKNSSVIVLINCGLTPVERKTYVNLFRKAGFKEIGIVPTCICALIGDGKNVSSTKTNMIVNIGGGTTDIAVVNLSRIIKGATLGLGGRAIDGAISRYIAYSHGLVIGLGMAESLKNQVGSLFKNDTLNMEVMGVDVETKIPRSEIITSKDIYSTIEPYFDEILRAVEVTITSLPPEISTDIVNNGVVFGGGVAQMNGFNDYLHKHFNFPFTICEDPENASILGGGKLLSDNSLLEKVIENF